MTTESILKFFQYPALSGQKKEEIYKKLTLISRKDVLGLDAEYCYNVVVGEFVNFEISLYNIVQ